MLVQIQITPIGTGLYKLIFFKKLSLAPPQKNMCPSKEKKNEFTGNFNPSQINKDLF